MKTLRVIGLMSGTSLDGVDAALLDTDGESSIRPRGWVHVPYSDDLRARTRALFNREPDAAIAHELTLINAQAVKEILQKYNLSPADIDVIGYHGQTIAHDPARRYTCQMGDGQLLAEITGINVVNDLRMADVKAGGQGAPLVPIYHQAMAAHLQKPVAILNIGGVANASYIGATGELIAFDVGPGNALLDDWMMKHTGDRYDHDGATASRGIVNEAALAQLLANEYFNRPAPKSLDRNHFSAAPLEGLSLEEGAATLAAFTVAGVALSLAHFPALPKQWLVAGGGRYNKFFMQKMADKLGVPVADIHTLGFNGDATEAEAWGYLAVRSLKGLPITFPMTTGIATPMTGGVLHRAPARAA